MLIILIILFYLVVIFISLILYFMMLIINKTALSEASVTNMMYNDAHQRNDGELVMPVAMVT